MPLIVLPCDGIGPEITRASIEVLDAANKLPSFETSNLEL